LREQRSATRWPNCGRNCFGRRASLSEKNERRHGLAFQCPQRPHFVTKQRMRSCCFALGTDEMAMVSLRLIASVTGTE
jgi:hypothetical protein